MEHCISCKEPVPEFCDGIIETRVDPFAAEIYDVIREIDVCETTFYRMKDDI